MAAARKTAAPAAAAAAEQHMHLQKTLADEDTQLDLMVVEVRFV